jgi:CubicO group peptidase (beta-lactamase class C family)
MRRTLAIAALALLAVHLPAKTLAESAEALAPSLPAGCIVTAEETPAGVRFALAGRSPDPQQAPETLVFEIASLTKLFTGLLLAQAVVEKQATLDTTVAEVLGPSFRFADERVGRITLRQLSTHTSGLPRMPDDFTGGFAGYATYDDAKMLAWLGRAKISADGPYACSYSNLGVALLGHLLAKRYGRTWEELVTTKVIEPLGLTHTRPSHRPAAGTLAPPFDGAKPTIVSQFQAFAPAGSLRSTAADLLKFGQALAHPERTPLKEAITLALQPHAENKGDKVGLGAFLAGATGRTAYVHEGATAGYRSAIQVRPAQGTIRIVLLDNTTFEGGAPLKGLP